MSYCMIWMVLLFTCGLTFRVCKVTIMHFHRWQLIQGLSGKYPSVFNISRTVPLALMWLGSQSVQTLLPICEQSPSCGASQSAVSCRWLSLCTVCPSYSQWPSEQISFITTLHLPILQLTSRLFWQSITSPRSVNPPTVQIWLPVTSVFSQS